MQPSIERGWPLAASFLALWCAFAEVARADQTTSEPQPELQLALDAGGHNGWVSEVLLNGYHDQFISVSRDKTIRFWDLKTGEPLRVLRPPRALGLPGKIYTADISPDGTLLAVAGETALAPPSEQRILLIALPEGKLIGHLAGHTDVIRAVRFSPDGKQLASGAMDRSIRLWNVAERKLERTLVGHHERVIAIAWSPDSKRLVSASWDHTARIWSATEGNTLAVLPGDSHDYMEPAWSHDGRTIVTCGKRKLRLWNSDGRYRTEFSGLDEDVSFVQWSDDDRRLLYGWGSFDSNIRGAAVIDLNRGVEQSRFQGHRNTPMCGQFLSDGETVVTGGPPGDIFHWRLRDGQLIRRIGGASERVMAVGWGHDGHTVGWSNHDAAGTTLHGTIPLERSFDFGRLDFGTAPDGSFARCRLFDNGLSLTRSTPLAATVQGTGAELRLPVASADKIRCFTFVPGNRVVMGCTTGLFAFDAYSGQATYNLPGHTDTVWGVAVSPDGRWLLTGAGDHTMQIWNTARFEHVLSLFVAGDEWVAWTPQGYYAASLAGESLMGWQVNRGPDHLADFYPAAQFRSTFYRPDIVRAVLPTGSPHAALVAADATLRVGKQPITLAAALPPHVALKIVGAPDVSGKIRLETTAAPQGNEPIKSLQLLVDGRPAALRDVGRQPSETGRDNTIREQFDLNIPPGEHRVAARAETEHGHGLSEPADVTNSNSPTAKSRLFVLALGVDGTPANALARRFAAADAHDVASALTTGGKRTFGETFHYVLTNDQVNRAGYQAGFDWLRRTMRPADVGIVYLIVPVGKQADGRAQLLAADGASLGLAADELAGALRQTAGQLHLWLDAIPPLSASGDPSERASGTAEPSGIAAVELLRQLRQPEVGVSVLGAARAREISQERDDWRHGALAQTLLQGLTGQADADHDGLVRASELEAYVRQAVEQLTGGAQHPIGGRAAMTTDVPLARP